MIEQFFCLSALVDRALTQAASSINDLWSVLINSQGLQAALTP